MKLISKILIPNKEWIIKENNTKIGSIEKLKKGYAFLKKGQKFNVKTLSEFDYQFDLEVTEKKTTSKQELKEYSIYNFPCSSKPYGPLFNLKKRLPIFAKSAKSKSQYCAGYYIIQFRKGWVKSFCPKLITLERYPYKGPFKTEQDMRSALHEVNKNETAKHYSD
jgi:hypothetical protein